MKAMYTLLRISKQAHLAFQRRRQKEEDEFLLSIPLLDQWREEHPCMSLKKLYVSLKPEFIGRNKFIDFCMAYGYEATRYAKVPKTSFPVCKRNFPNLLKNKLMVDINQVLVSDITYFKLFGRFYYLTFIMDLYSRRIIGHHVCDHLFAQANVEALKVALTTTGISKFNYTLIHHSDRGSQYDSLLYTSALDEAQIKISMGRIVYDNIHMERTHQVIKSEYLIHRNIVKPQDLPKHLDEVVYLYNHKRPHGALAMRTPVDFERDILSVPLFQRTPMRVFALDTKLQNRSNTPCDPKQLFLPFNDFLS